MFWKNKKIEEKDVVKELIQNRQYFSVGYEWYFDKYLGFFWQKQLFFALTFLVCIAVFFLFKMNYDIMISSKIPKPVITYVNHYDDVAFIKRLKFKDTNDPNILIARYLVEKYVTQKESYDYRNLDSQNKFLFSNSTSFLYLDHLQTLDISNPISPLLLYGRSEILVTNVKNIEIFTDDIGLPNRAGINFDVYRVSSNDKTILGNYDANIDFYMNDIYSVQKNHNTNFIFSVFRYNVIKNKNSTG